MFFKNPQDVQQQASPLRLNHGFWVIVICQCWFINCYQPVRDVENRAGYVYVDVGVIWGNLCIALAKKFCFHFSVRSYQKTQSFWDSATLSFQIPVNLKVY